MPETPQVPKLRIRHEHVTASAIASGVIAIVLSIFQGRDVSNRVDSHGHEISEATKALALKLDDQTKTISTLQLTLVEIRSQGLARDAAFERIARDLNDVVKQLRELEQARARDGEQLREHDRRLGAIEGKR